MNLIKNILIIIVLFISAFYWLLSSLEMKEGRTLDAIYYILISISIYIVVGFASL